MTREFSKKQVRRLSGQPFFRADEFAIRALVDALLAVSENDGHAEKIINECLQLVDEDGRAVCAAPQDIRRIGHATRTTELKPHADCLQCGGSGWKIAERIVRGVRASGAEKCSCWKIAPKTEVPDYKSQASEPELAHQIAARKGML